MKRAQAFFFPLISLSLFGISQGPASAKPVTFKLLNGDSISGELLKKEIFRLLFQQNSQTLLSPQQAQNPPAQLQSQQNLIYAVIPADGTDDNPYPKVVYVSDPDNPGSFNTSILSE